MSSLSVQAVATTLCYAGCYGHVIFFFFKEFGSFSNLVGLHPTILNAYLVFYRLIQFYPSFISVYYIAPFNRRDVTVASQKK